MTLAPQDCYRMNCSVKCEFDLDRDGQVTCVMCGKRDFSPEPSPEDRKVSK